MNRPEILDKLIDPESIVGLKPYLFKLVFTGSDGYVWNNGQTYNLILSIEEWNGQFWRRAILTRKAVPPTLGDIFWVKSHLFGNDQAVMVAPKANEPFNRVHLLSACEPIEYIPPFMVKS